MKKVLLALLLVIHLTGNGSLIFAEENGADEETSQTVDDNSFSDDEEKDVVENCAEDSNIIESTSNDNEENIIEIIFDKNAEDAIGEIQTQSASNDGTVVLQKNLFTRQNYSFNGWNTAQDGSGIAYGDEETISLTSDIEKKLVLFAQWAETENVTVNEDTIVEEIFVETPEAASIVQSGTCGQSARWTLDETGTLRINGIGSIYDYDLTTLVERPGQNPWVKQGVHRIIIEKGITRIGKSAFSGLTVLTYIQIPDTVTEIADYALSKEYSLTSITIPESVKTIGEYAFYDCDRLKSISIPGSVRVIPHNMCWNCPALESVELNTGTKTIGMSAFASCTNLSTVNLPDTLETIGEAAFRSCESLKSISLPESITAIDKQAFQFCKSLENVEINGNLSSLSDHLFMGCTNLKVVNIPDSVTSIGSGVFNSCEKLSEISLPENLTTIGSSAFRGCISLNNIELPNSIEIIGGSAFESCSKLQQIKLPKNIKEIGWNTFENCTSLEYVILNDSLQAIGEEAFLSCSSLKAAIIPEKVTKIGQEAFGGCNNLIAISIPSSVTRIDKNIFDGCSSLKTILYQGNDESWQKIKFGENNKLLNSTITYDKYPYILSLSNNRMTADVGERFQPEYKIIPDITVERVIHIESSNNQIVSIDDNQIINCISSGTAKITIESEEGVSAEFDLIIRDKAGVFFLDDEYTMTTRQTKQFELSTRFEEGDSQNLIWNSSDESVFTVDVNGKVKALKQGEAELTVRTEDNKYSDTCKIIVLPSPSSIEINPAPAYIRIGEQQHIDVRILPEAAPQDYSIVQDLSSPYGIIDTNNNIYGKKRGTITYRVKTSNGLTEEAKAYVIDPAYEENLELFVQTVKEKAEPTGEYKDSLYHGFTHAINFPENNGFSYIGYHEEYETICFGKIDNSGSGQADFLLSYDPKAQKIITMYERIYVSGGKILTGYAVVDNTINETTVSPNKMFNISVYSNKSITESQKSLYANEIKPTLRSWMNTLDLQLRMMEPHLNLRDLGFSSWFTSGAPYVDGVTINKKEITLTEGDIYSLEATVIPDEGDVNHIVFWKSSDDEVASVDNNGKVMAKKAGEAIITVVTMESNKKAICDVKVNPFIHVEEVRLSKNSIEIQKGESVSLECSILPENSSDKSITWYSDAPNVAVVDEQGRVTGLDGGNVNISAVSNAGNISAVCAVTVNNTTVFETTIMSSGNNPSTVVLYPESTSDEQIITDIKNGYSSGISMSVETSLGKNKKNYKADNVAFGSYKLAVYKEGYIPLIKKINIDANNNIEYLTLRSLGDVNNDNEVDVSDIIKIRDVILKTQKVTGDDAKAADVNKDGEIDVSDIIKIRDRILGIVGEDYQKKS